MTDAEKLKRAYDFIAANLEHMEDMSKDSSFSQMMYESDIKEAKAILAALDATAEPSRTEQETRIRAALIEEFPTITERKLTVLTAMRVDNENSPPFDIERDLKSFDFGPTFNYPDEPEGATVPVFDEDEFTAYLVNEWPRRNPRVEIAARWAFQKGVEAGRKQTK